MKKNYLHKLKEKFVLKKIDSIQPIGTWIFVITLNIFAFLGYFVFNLYGINVTN